MGSGCSSPLRRFGGRRGKPTRRSSSIPGEANGDKNEPINSQDQERARQQQIDSQQHQQHKFILDNEITIQSEANDDHPSGVSYYTGGKYLVEVSGDATNITTTSSNNKQNLGSDSVAKPNPNSASAKTIGLNGSYVPLDRHLLVSPALSPAPSVCHSPSPASSNVGANSTVLDLNDLNQAFVTLTLGPGNHPGSRIKQPERHQSELCKSYTQQLYQTQTDLINYVSVIFITTDNLFQIPANKRLQPTHEINRLESMVAGKIESSLKSFCDEHSYNLRFLNLSHEHLSKYFRVNNLADVSTRILKQEYQDNGQRLITIVLSNNVTSVDEKATERQDAGQQTTLLDRIQLPGRIEVQSMNKLLQADFVGANINGDKAKESLNRWYSQTGNSFNLTPINMVKSKLLEPIKEDCETTWQTWINDSDFILKAISALQENGADLEIKLKHLANSQLDFIVKEPNLLKRTLLIRNSSQPSNINQNTNPQSLVSNHTKDANLNELSKLLADPNKLTLKRQMNDDELNKTIIDWISESFNKFYDNILENQITHGKHVPPFIERNLFTELTCQRHQLDHYLDNTSDSFESKCQNFYNSQISPLFGHIADASSRFSSPDAEQPIDYKPISCNEEPKQSSTNHLVFISGPKGCGKSTLFAQLIRLTVQDLLDKAQIIYRFCGVSLDSLGPDRLLRSICEQFCQTQGENITAASYIYSARGDVINSLNKILKSQNSLIFLDGLDRFGPNLIGQDLDWLCEIEANPTIKIIIMIETDSDLYKKALGTYTDATYISLDHPSTSEWAHLLTSTARSKRFNSASNFYDEIKNLSISNESKEISNLSYSEVSDTLHMCRIRKLNNESIYPELSVKQAQGALNLIRNLKNVQQLILSHLKYLIKPYHLCALFIAIDSSRNGLAETDIINFLTMISQSPKITTAANTNGNNENYKFSPALFNYLKIQLRPWLIFILCNDVVKITMQRDLLNRALEIYTPSKYQVSTNEIKELLLEYFNRQTRPRSSIISAIKGTDSIPLSEPKENISLSQRLWLATQASETMNLLISSNPAKTKDYIMNKYQFFLQFCYGSIPEEFIEDYKRLENIAGKKPWITEELTCLVDCVRHSVYPLRYNGSQVFSQIYCRTYESNKTGKIPKGKKLSDIVSIASSPPIRNLLPISEASINSFIKTRIGLNQLSSSRRQSATSDSTTTTSDKKITKLAAGQPTSGPYQTQAKQRIYNIRDNHRHMIVIHPDKGILSVWDIYEEKAVRSITNLDQPRDLRMIDQKRAVVLCNRELRVYDLDSGILLTKLKGVMNQKMPFFEIYGENYVVALARNRMYVNMLNLNTGELETTFKVGEDRFLNSLLVSANGGICVCGDETQKPFPLLVWNLNERRLMYDLRLDRHEFITRMSAISDDGHFVVSVCRQIGDNDHSNHGSSSGNNISRSSNSNITSSGQRTSPNFIVIYDLSSGTLFKKWKPGLDTCAVVISLPSNKSGKVINTIVDSTILVWDLATGSKRHTLIGHTAPADVVKVRDNCLFSMDSTCRDQSLRMWDIEEGYCLAVFSPNAPVSCCQLSTRGDALVCGFAAETRLSTLVLCKNETVSDVVKRNKRRKSSKSLYVFDEPPSRKSSS